METNSTFRNGQQIFYTTNGKTGPWVTLINGHTRPMSDFKQLARFLSESGFRVICLDNRGSGSTEASEQFILQDIADDILHIWEELSISQSHIMGISMGGMIAMAISTEHSNRILSVVLVSTTHLAQFNRSKDFEWPNDKVLIFEHLRSYVSINFATKNKLLLDAMAKQILKNISKGSFQEQSQYQRKAIAKWLSENPDLKRITVPTLIIHGKEDQIIDCEAANILSSEIPKAESKLLEGVGHLILAESPKKLRDFALDFMKRY